MLPEQLNPTRDTACFLEADATTRTVPQSHMHKHTPEPSLFEVADNSFTHACVETFSDPT